MFIIQARGGPGGDASRLVRLGYQVVTWSGHVVSGLRDRRPMADRWPYSWAAGADLGQLV